mmetsp:Transcript_5681/g.12474  ORF Transcript_5681/g.12474 Transcript_5681/m.12474 type:complete len:445 (-) Transcript_5681:631-1965(-)
MSEEVRTPISIEDLYAGYAEWRDGHSTAAGVTKSSSAIVSIISSSALIWMVLRSRDRLSTAYHRLLLGMSIADLLVSFQFASFQAMIPSDVNYAVWNAGGNQASCIAQGFFAVFGWSCSLLYSCSLNIFSLAIVKYNKPERYIRTKMEPFLHGVPILHSLAFCILGLVTQGFNGNVVLGECFLPVYDPPHCIGYEDGQVREGFEIPCGRGSDAYAAFSYAWALVLSFGTPITVVATLGMMFKHVSQLDKRITRYGAAAISGDAPQQNADTAAPTTVGGIGGFSSRVISSVASSVGSTFGRSFRSNSNERLSNGRRVMHRAIAYSIAYLLTWSWFIAMMVMWMVRAPVPNALDYIASIFSPLQGLFNLMIFMQPKVMTAKRSQGGNLSWCQAFAKAFGLPIRTAGTYRNENAPPNIVAAARKPSEVEEEKMEIQPHPQDINQNSN